MSISNATRLLLASLATILIAPSVGHAAVTTTSVAGPSADLAGADDVRVDSAPDGTTALAFRQTVGAQSHVFVSVLDGTTWSTPEQVDDGIPGAPKPSTNPTLAVANGGRIVVVFPNGDAGSEKLFAAVKVSSATPFAAPQQVQGDPAGWKDPQLDLAPGGNGYLAVQEAKHVRAFLVQGSNFQPVGAGFPNPNLPGAGGGVLNTDEPEPGEMRGAKIAVDGTGNTATVIWTQSPVGGEYHFFARRLSGLLPTQIGPAVESTVPTFQGHAGTTAFNDMGTVATAGGTTWIGYRAAFTYNNPPQQIPRALVRTFDGTTFGEPQTIDGIPAVTTQGAEFPRIALNEAGQGLGASYRQLDPFGTESATLAGGLWSPATFTAPPPSTAPGRAAVALDANGAGLVAFFSAPTPTTPQVLGRIRGGAADGTLETLSNPAFGVASAPYTAGAANGRAVTAFVQGTAATTRVVAAIVDLPPTPAPTPTPSPGPAPTPTPTPPKTTLSALKFRNGKTTGTVRRGSALPKVVSAKSTKRTFSFALDQAAPVTFTLQRIATGKRSKGGCVPGKAKRKASRCTLRRTVPGSATIQAAAGTTHIQFEGRLTKGRALPLGRYELTAVATAPSATASAPATITYALEVPRRKR